MTAAARRRWTSVAIGALAALLSLGYPFAIYLGLTHFSARHVGAMLLLLFVPTTAARLRRADRRDLWRVLPAPILALALILLTVASDDHRFVLALPVLVSLVIGAGFAASLRSDRSLIERFARMHLGDVLTVDEIRYCRSVTLAWTIFLGANAAIAGALAVWGPLSWWTLYSGLIAYVAIGTIFIVEFLIRSYRFRRYGTGLHDRLAARIFPPPAAS